MSGPARDGGFTLLELLVALVLLGLLIAGLAPSLGIGAAAWDAVDRDTEASARMQAVQDFVRLEVAEAYPAAFVDDRGGRRIAYQGNATSLTLVAPMPAHLGLGGMQVVRIAVEEEHGRRMLVALWNAFPPEARVLGVDGDARRSVLVDDIAGASFRYFGRDTPNDDPEWTEEWAGRRSLPILVRFRVTFPPGDGRNWPDLMVRSRIDIPAMVRS